MNGYDFLMSPLEKLRLEKIRKQLIVRAAGRVLEIGFGTGVNLKYYEYSQVTHLSLIDVELNQTGLDNLPPDASVWEGNAEQLPFEDNSFDTVVQTLVLCSVSQPAKAVREIARVLKPGGKLIFIEHVLSDHHIVAGIQNGGNLIWPHIAGGCNLNRNTEKIIKENGFVIKNLHKFGMNIFISGTAAKI